MTEGVTPSARADLAVIGAGAAGLMAAISAGRRAREQGLPLRIVALDGAKTIGAKILVAGGGRCNVTHHEVTEQAYAGGSRNAIRNVLRAFSVADTVSFFADLGVVLKREDTGKLFPVSDDGRTVLAALLGAAHAAGVEIQNPRRVESIERDGEGFVIRGDWGALAADRIILATGGKALPRSGSDGHGYLLAKALGHTITDHVFPALVPLILAPDCFLRALSGIALPARLELRSGTGKRLTSFTSPTLCTHFGLSGPGPMDISRYYTDARREDAGAHLVACWLPDAERTTIDADLQALGKRSVAKHLRDTLTERFADAICGYAGLPPAATGASLRKDERRALLDALFEMPLPITGDRGFTHAEVTAGGVPLPEVDIKSMASRVCPGLWLCGEVLDVDGRIGGFNFQWAWASGYIAGRSAAGAAAGA